MNEDIERILDTLKEHYDGLGWPYYPEDVLNPKDTKIIYDYIIQLQNNWNELKNSLKDELNTIKTTCSQVNGNYFMMNDKIEWLEERLNQMQELESNNE